MAPPYKKLSFIRIVSIPDHMGFRPLAAGCPDSALLCFQHLSLAASDCPGVADGGLGVGD
jgi:hypothetical protein